VIGPEVLVLSAVAQDVIRDHENTVSDGDSGAFRAPVVWRSDRIAYPDNSSSNARRPRLIPGVSSEANCCRHPYSCLGVCPHSRGYPDRSAPTTRDGQPTESRHVDTDFGDQCGLARVLPAPPDPAPRGSSAAGVRSGRGRTRRPGERDHGATLLAARECCRQAPQTWRVGRDAVGLGGRHCRRRPLRLDRSRAGGDGVSAGFTGSTRGSAAWTA
jgi:hypothetical protein